MGLLIMVFGIIFLLIVYAIYKQILKDKYINKATELNDVAKIFQYLKKDIKENKQKEKLELETALKNGTAYILPPKYFLIPHFVHVIFRLTIVIGFIYVMVKLIFDADKLAETCEMIYGLNSIFFKDLIFLPIYFLYLFFLMKKINKSRKSKQKQPPKKVKPNLFSERLVFQDEKIDKKVDFVDIIKEQWAIMAIVTLNIISSNIPNVTNDLIHLNIAQANENYQQRCLAKEFPFKDLRKNQP